MNRRRLLQAAGLASGSLFLPSLIGDKAAYAQAATLKRLLVFYTQHGPVMNRWELRPQGMDATPQGEWELPLGPLKQADFGETLQPLHPYRDDVLILEGLAMTNMLADKGGNNHDLGTGARLTGAMQADAKRVSFDQYIADQIAVPGRFKYLAFTPNAGDVSNAGFFDTAGHSVVLARVDNTYGFLGNQYKRVFDGVSTMPTTPTGPPSGMDLSRARRQESVEFVRGQYEKMLNRLSADDRKKLALHRDMLADLALRVDSISQLKCEKPAYPAKGSQSDMEIAKIVLTNLFPVAMACDLTRVRALSSPSAPRIGHRSRPRRCARRRCSRFVGRSPWPPRRLDGEHYKLHAGQFAEDDRTLSNRCPKETARCSTTPCSSGQWSWRTAGTISIA